MSSSEIRALEVLGKIGRLCKETADELRASFIDKAPAPGSEREQLLGEAIRALIRGDIKCSDDLPPEERPVHVGAKRAFGAVYELLRKLERASQAPAPAPVGQAAADYQAMFLDAARALAEIDAILGLPEDGCNDPQVTVSALKDYVAGAQEVAGFRDQWVEAQYATAASQAPAVRPDDVRDAARYRFLRDTADADIYLESTSRDMDARVDAAMDASHVPVQGSQS